jgi:ABC-type polysaccharide/polyol phosphate export permease
MASLVFGLGFLYSQIFHISFREYLSFVAAGLLAWYFIVANMTEACGIVNEAEPHLRSLPVPITIFAARMVYRNLIIFAHNAVVVLILLVVLRGGLSPLVLLAPTPYSASSSPLF